MRINRLTIQGFRSFAAAQELDLSAMRPGLYHVTGTNEVEPSLEGNGVGKSSLFEAIYWILKGTTSRGLKAGAVQNWNSTERCAGILDLQTAAGTVGVMRSWQPNQLEAEWGGHGPRPTDQDQLDQVVGMPADVMLFAIYFAQFTNSFIDLKAAEQTELFTSVLQLGVWDKAAAAATRDAKEYEGTLQDLREAVARLEGEAQALLSVDHMALADAWEKEQASITRAAQDVVEDAEARVVTSKASLEAATKGAETFRTLRAQELVAAQTLAAQAALVGHLSHEIDALDAEARAAKVPPVCRTCGQALPVKKVRQHMRDELIAKSEELAALNEEADQLREVHAALAKRMTKHAQAERTAGEAQAEFDSALRFRKAAWAQLEQMRRLVNPHAATALQVETRGQALADELDQHAVATAAAQQDLEGALYWIKGFKEVRLALIRDSLAQLEIECNEALFQLGLRDWSMAFHVERENKSGGIANKFGVTVKAPHTEAPVPWEAWSGGESQRLRISASMGFANLVCSRAGLQPNVEFWDEPSQWLSGSGIADLLQVLADRAARLKKVILLADHRSLEFGGFAGTIRLVKDRAGTRILPPV